MRYIIRAENTAFTRTVEVDGASEAVGLLCDWLQAGLVLSWIRDLNGRPVSLADLSKAAAAETAINLPAGAIEQRMHHRGHAAPHGPG